MFATAGVPATWFATTQSMPAITAEVLLEPEQSHLLLVYTAVPGSESYEKLQLLSVIGHAIACPASVVVGGARHAP